MKTTTLIILFLTFWVDRSQAQEIDRKILRTKIPSHFTMLERDSIGYLKYEPCDGSTPKIDIEGNYIIIQGQLESDRFRIHDIKKKRRNSFIIVICDQHDDAPEKSSQSKMHIQLVNKSSHLWLLEWGYSEPNEYRWIMANDSELPLFRVIDNPCGEGKIAEKKFLEIEY
jgi:hypothetical protein